MSFARTSVETAVVSMVVEATGIRWILANQEGEKPPRPYGTVLVSDSLAIGQGEFEALAGADSTQLIERMREVFEVSVSLNAFGPDAFDHLASIKTHVRRPSVWVGTWPVIGLGFMSASNMRDLSAVVSAGREGRAQMDMVFSARFTQEFVLATVARVDITGAGGTQTVEVP